MISSLSIRSSLNNLVHVVLLCICLLSLTSCSSENEDEKYSRKIESAKSYLETNKLQEARIELQTAIDIKPLEAQGYFLLAETQVRLGDYGAALENYNSAINYNPNYIDALIHLSSLQLIAKQFEYAESNLNKALELEPNNEEAKTLMGNLTYIGPSKNPEKARAILKSILRRNPEYVPALGSLGHLELAEEDFSQSEKYFVEALKIEPGNQAIQVALADLYSRQGRIKESQQSIQNLVDKNPENPGYRYVLGEFFLRRGLNDNALDQYKEVLSNDPEVHHARDRLYDIYVGRREYEKAKSLTEELEAHNPESELLSYFKGRNEELKGNTSKALDYYLQAITNSSTFASSFKNAGKIEITIGKTKEGIEHLEQAINIDPNDVGARFALAKTNLYQGNIEEAKIHVTKILEQFPRHLGANIIRADISLLEDDLSRAEKVYSFLLETYPKLPIGYYKLGLLEEKKGNLEKAISYYKKTLEFDTDALNPGRRMILSMNKMGKNSKEIISELSRFKEQSTNKKAEFELLIGSILVSDPSVPNRLEMARKHFKHAINLNPNLIGAYFSLGGIDALTGNLNEASENYKKLLIQNPNHIPTRMLLALTYEQLGKYEQAVEHYNKILDANPRFGPAANNLAYILTDIVKDADLNEALKLAQVAKEELPRESSVADTLAWVHYKKGNVKAALPILNEALKLAKEYEPQNPVHPEILYHLALVHRDLNNTEEAKNYINKALEGMSKEHPKFNEIKKVSQSL